MTQLSGPLLRRSTATIAAMAAAGLVLTGCGAGAPEGEGPAFDFTGKDKGAMSEFAVGDTFKATEPVQFSIFYRDHEAYPLKQDWPFLTALEDNQNVSFDIESSPRVGYEDARSAAIASGNAPEIITVTYPGQETPFVSGGALLPVSDFTKYMPNFTDKIEKWGLEKDLDNLRQADGKFYLLPGVSEIVVPQYSYVVRKDIWDELGLSLEPKTFDELAEDFAKVKKAYPDKVVISDEFNSPDPLGGALNFAAPNFGTAAGWGFSAGSGGWWDGDKFVYAAATDEYKSLVEYYHGLVEDGIMSPASVTQTDDDAKASFFNGDSLVISGNDQFLTQARQSFDEVGNTDAEVALLRVPAGPAGDNLAAGGRLDGLPGIMISSKAAESENFKALLQFIDWLYYSDSGLEFAKWGVEDLTFTRDGDTREFTSDWDRAKGLFNPDATKLLNVDGGFANGAFMAAEGGTEDLRTSMMLPETKDFVSSMLTKTQLPTAPAAPLNEIENEQAGLWKSALLDLVRQNTAAFITGDRDISEWDDYIDELKAANLDQYLELLNTAQKRQAEALAGGSDDE
ncbi:extracellular solute-binding protein [Microbacterium ulmi]|uniref:Extracellular solute-binding protein n=1 Tax=Microbacterium ulmi TaxID=179095 RepID=A0A7Y2M163_9MICO|nr:extracellular solute-binding protein [Microbacterium ulmi]NII70005.1 putative aldouronate transport system substrate-binding protein [Microbacterium ulmi]NNH04565.1 extracellular solute-binding protein [Microbacterium ulmi]